MILNLTYRQRRIYLAVVTFYLCSVFCLVATMAGEIEIRRADYGLRAVYCNAAPAFAAHCDGKPSCEVEVAAAVLCPDGQDPVPGTIKKLTVKYSCGDGVKTFHSRGDELVVIACEGARAGLETIEVVEFVGRTLTPPASTDPDCVREDLRVVNTDDADHSASCWELCLKVPVGADIQRVYGWSRKANTMNRKWRSCGSTPGSCNQPTESFYNDYRVNPTPTGQQLCWTFRNWSTTMDRDAKMTVQYAVAPD
jgi:hypothetical protein